MKFYIDGELYESRLPITISSSRGELPVFKTEPPTLRVINRCEHCGRSDLVEVVCHSKEELVEQGWAVKA